MNRVFICSCLFFLIGCTSPRQIKITYRTNYAAETGKSEFVELNDGTIIEGKGVTVSISELFGKKKGFIAINNKQYNYSDVIAFQRDSVYYRKSKGWGYVQRTLKGSINVFFLHVDRGVGTSHTYYFLQKGVKEEVVVFSIKTLRQMVGDYQPALDWANKYKKKKRNEYLDNAISVYNSK